MTPLLFSSTERHFLLNDGIPLKDAIKCRVTDNGLDTFMLEMDYPVTGVHFNDIDIGSMIYVPVSPADCTLENNTDVTSAYLKYWQPFYVVSYHVDDSIVTFTAHHLFYMTDRLVVSPDHYVDTETNPYLSNHLNEALEGSFDVIYVRHPYICPEYGTQYFRIHRGSYATDKLLDEPCTFREFVLSGKDSIARTYGYYARYAFVRTYDTNTNTYTTKLYMYLRPTNLASKDTGIILRKGYEFSRFTYDYDPSDRVNYIIPYVLDSDGLTKDMYSATGDYPTGHENDQAVNGSGGGPGTTPALAIPYNVSEYMTNTPTKKRLYNAGKKAYKKGGFKTAYENLTIDLIGGNVKSKVDTERAVSGVNSLKLYDIITVMIPEIRLSKKMQIVKTVFDVLQEAWVELELGTTKMSMFTVRYSNGTPQFIDLPSTVVVEGETDIDPTPSVDPDDPEPIIPDET